MKCNHEPATSTFTENSIPISLVVGGQKFSRANAQQDLRQIEEIQFDRVPGKSTNLILYRSTNPRKSELLLHTPETLNLGANGVIAKKRAPWDYSEILRSGCFAKPAQDQAVPLKRILTYDHMTEGDSIRLFNYLVRHDPGMPAEFWPVMILWLKDEMNHFKGFHFATEQTLGIDAEEEKRMAVEESDFHQFDSILSDPFWTLIALSYDEASTIAGYHHDLHYYSTLGPSMVSFVKRVSGDEGWHFSKFLALAIKYFDHRFDEVPHILQEASRLDGKPYRRTFFLDHDPRVESQFTEALKNRSSSIVLKTLYKKTHAH